MNTLTPIALNPQDSEVTEMLDGSWVIMVDLPYLDFMVSPQWYFFTDDETVLAAHFKPRSLVRMIRMG